ncbi:kinase-like domain-containing protein [Mycena leptocephala]|nr:kinase-like domain-containing protein [Mycena leptocephala]
MPPPRRSTQIPPLAASNMKKKQAQFHSRDDLEEDTVLPVFGGGKGGQRINPPSHKHPNTRSPCTLGTSTERWTPRERRNLPASPLCSPQKPDNLPDASNSNAPTAEAFVRRDRDRLCDRDPCHRGSVKPPSLRESHSSAKNIDLSIPKLTVILSKESSSGIETCFGDPLLSDDDGALTRSISQLDRFPLCSGSNSNIYRANLMRSDGQKILVAMKAIRIHDDDLAETDSIMKRLKREVGVWSKLKHPNILPFLGVYDIDAPLPIFLSPFYKFGHVENYLRNHPSANRHQLMHGVAFGLEYLHKNDVVHGNLEARNVLVDKRHVPCICDFGFSRIVGEAGFTTYGIGSTTHIAPELFAVLDMDGESTKLTPPARATKSSDVYSFGCLALEILNPAPPPAKIGSPFVTPEGLDALRPNRPDYPTGTVSHDMWFVLDQCWFVDPHQRPTMAEILASLAFSVAQRRESLTVPGLVLKTFSDGCSDGEEIGFGDPCLRSLPGEERRPRYLVEHRMFATGDYCDIFRGNLNLWDGQGVQVAVKIIRPNSNDDPTQVQALMNRLNREARLWTKLRHPNVLPFLGIYDVGRAIPILVSPFCKFGHVREYLQNHSHANRNQLVHGVAAGVKYLHDLGIVHGDLKAENVLIDKRGVASIVDFGIFSIVDVHDSPPDRTMHMAPELLAASPKLVRVKHRPSPPTKMSDMYSFALVILEILTVEGPREPLLAVSVQAPAKPVEAFLRPTRAQYGVDMVSPSMWTVLEQCWNFNPELRPPITEILDSPPFFGLGR